MPPPSQLAIATSSLIRLVKEESTYRTELSSQQERLALFQEGPGPGEMEEDVENTEFRRRQEVRPFLWVVKEKMERGWG